MHATLSVPVILEQRAEDSAILHAAIVHDGNKELTVLNSGTGLTPLTFFGSLGEKPQGPLAQFLSCGLSTKSVAE